MKGFTNERKAELFDSLIENLFIHGAVDLGNVQRFINSQNGSDLFILDEKFSKVMGSIMLETFNRVETLSIVEHLLPQITQRQLEWAHEVGDKKRT